MQAHLLQPKILNYSMPKICAADFSISVHFFTVELGSEDRIPQEGVSEFHTDLMKTKEEKDNNNKKDKKPKITTKH